MSQLIRADLHAAIETRYPDNTTAKITPELLREGLHELVDSVFVTATDTGAVPNVPEYDPAATYVVGFTVRYAPLGGQQAFYAARRAGKLGTPHLLSNEWKVVPGPVPATQLGQQISLLQAQNMNGSLAVLGRDYAIQWPTLSPSGDPQVVVLAGIADGWFASRGWLVVAGKRTYVEVDIAAGTWQEPQPQLSAAALAGTRPTFALNPALASLGTGQLRLRITPERRGATAVAWTNIVSGNLAGPTLNLANGGSATSTDFTYPPVNDWFVETVITANGGDYLVAPDSAVNPGAFYNWASVIQIEGLKFRAYGTVPGPGRAYVTVQPGDVIRMQQEGLNVVYYVNGVQHATFVCVRPTSSQRLYVVALAADTKVMARTPAPSVKLLALTAADTLVNGVLTIHSVAAQAGERATLVGLDGNGDEVPLATWQADVDAYTKAEADAKLLAWQPDAYTKAQADALLATKQPAVQEYVQVSFYYQPTVTLGPVYLNTAIEVAVLQDTVLTLPSLSAANTPATLWLKLYATNGDWKLTLRGQTVADPAGPLGEIKTLRHGQYVRLDAVQIQLHYPYSGTGYVWLPTVFSPTYDDLEAVRTTLTRRPVRGGAFADLTAADIGCVVPVADANGTTLTVPAGLGLAAVSGANGSERICFIRQEGVGLVTLAFASGVNPRYPPNQGPTSQGQNAKLTLTWLDTNTVLVEGGV